MLKIKSLPRHNFGIHIDLKSNIDYEQLIGRLDANNKLIENETEAEIDGKQCIVQIHDQLKCLFEHLPLYGFIFKITYGFDGKAVQEVLLKKFPDKITPKTEVVIMLYELLEF